MIKLIQKEDELLVLSNDHYSLPCDDEIKDYYENRNEDYWFDSNPGDGYDHGYFNRNYYFCISFKREERGRISSMNELVDIINSNIESNTIEYKLILKEDVIGKGYCFKDIYNFQWILDFKSWIKSQISRQPICQELFDWYRLRLMQSKKDTLNFC